MKIAPLRKQLLCEYLFCSVTVPSYFGSVDIFCAFVLDTYFIRIRVYAQWLRNGLKK